jgi:hypothetical protein
MQLSKHVSVAPRFSRSINLERDARTPAVLDGYVITSTAKTVLERVCEALTNGTPGHQCAWTFTGAYGSGKSAFALFLGSLLASANSDSAIVARSLLQDQFPDIHSKFFDKRRHNGIAGTGFRTVFVSGSPEPIVDRLLDCCVRDFSTIRIARSRFQALTILEKLQRNRKAGKEVDASHFVSALTVAAQQLRRAGQASGILIIIDELGKFLEYAARAPEHADIFVLQQLAEATSPDGGLALVTILHQAFDRYATGLRTSMRDEWAKVQGRFEDIAFQEPVEQLLLLIGEAIQHSADAVTQELTRRARKFAEEAWRLGMAPSGLNQREFTNLMSRCAPLHPVTALALVRLCKKFGQNQRSLFAFLVSREPHSFFSFLEDEKREPHFYKLPDLYDYVAENFGAGLSVGENATRWAEVQSTLDKCSKASDLDTQVIKVVGLLTAIGISGSLKASRELIEFALDGHPRPTRSSIDKLLDASVLVHRKHSGAFALWQGSDVDIEARSIEAKQKLDASLISSKVSLSFRPRPLIAKRHSYQTGTLRYFEVRFVNYDEFWSSLAPSEGSDGLILYCLPNSDADYRQLMEFTSSSAVRERLDVLIAIPRDIEQLKEAVRDLEVLNWISSNTPELAGDAVGRRELRSRKALAEIRVADEINNLFAPDSPVARKTNWYHRGIQQPVLGSRSLATFLSDICDLVYCNTPRLKNELLNRRYLSSAAAAARRNLIDYMITHTPDEALGMQGHPPEMSMYASVLRATGIHRKQGDILQFGAPLHDEGLLAVWKEIEHFFGECELRRRPVSELFDALQKAPYGLKLGLIPVLFCAVVLAHDTEIAIYENDAFVPELSVELFERLLPSPDKFKLRRYNIEGVRKDVFKQFAALLTKNEESSEKPSVLAVVRPLFRFLSRLPEYTRQTRSLNQKALSVREALFAAREPDSLLFEDLPKACVFEPFSFGVESVDVQGFFTALHGALGELQRAYDELLSNLERLLFAAFGSAKEGQRAVLKFRAKQVLDHAVDPRLKAFAHHLCDEELDDVLWIEAIATLIVGRPPKGWNDLDRAKYEVMLTDLVRTFRHVEALVFETARQTTLGKAPVEVIRLGVTDGHSKDTEAVVAIHAADRERLASTVFELEGCLEKLGVHSDANLSLAAMAVVCRKLLDDLLHERRTSEQEPRIRGAANV